MQGKSDITEDTNVRNDAKAEQHRADDTCVDCHPQGGRKHKGWMIGLAIAGGLVLLASGLLIGRWSQPAMYNRLRAEQPFMGGQAGMMSKIDGHGFKKAGSMSGGLRNQTDGTEYTRLRGVVTEVSESQLTIAGNGTTKTINLNNATEYIGKGDKPATNDSVMVIGTDKDGTFTAAKVRVVNR